MVYAPPSPESVRFLEETGCDHYDRWRGLLGFVPRFNLSQAQYISVCSSLFSLYEKRLVDLGEMRAKPCLRPRFPLIHAFSFWSSCTVWRVLRTWLKDLYLETSTFLLQDSCNLETRFTSPLPVGSEHESRYWAPREVELEQWNIACCTTEQDQEPNQMRTGWLESNTVILSPCIGWESSGSGTKLNGLLTSTISSAPRLPSSHFYIPLPPSVNPFSCLINDLNTISPTFVHALISLPKLKFMYMCENNVGNSCLQSMLSCDQLTWRLKILNLSTCNLGGTSECSFGLAFRSCSTHHIISRKHYN